MTPAVASTSKARVFGKRAWQYIRGMLRLVDFARIPFEMVQLLSPHFFSLEDTKFWIPSDVIPYIQAIPNALCKVPPPSVGKSCGSLLLTLTLSLSLTLSLAVSGHLHTQS